MGFKKRIIEKEIPAAPPIQGSPEEKRGVILTAILTSFLTPFMGSAVTVALPVMDQDLSLNTIGVSWVANIYLLASAVFLLPCGRLADIIGRKKILGWGMFLFFLSSLGSALVPDFFWLMVMRFFQGLAGSMIFSTSMALVVSVTAPSERGKIIGYTVAAVYTGLSMGPVIGGLATQYLGWRSIFLIPLPLCLWVLEMIVRRIKSEWAEAAGESFDWRGSGFYILSLVPLMIGVTLLPHLIGGGLISIGLGGIFLFVWYEKGRSHSLFPLKLFSQNRVFAFSNLAAFINYSATFAIPFLLSLYLQKIRGFHPQETGFILITQPLFQAVFSPLAGRLSDRIDSRIIASAGMGVCTSGLIGFVFLQPYTHLIFILFNLALLGFGFALFSSPNTSAIMGAVERKEYGVASATLATMRMSGQMLSMTLLTMLLAVIMGNEKINILTRNLFLKTGHIAFLIFAGLCFFGIFASLARGRRNHP